MDFTREPVVETVITPREGCKLVVRSSKGSGQEEYFVDSVEVVSFGNAFFFRSLEKPKNFLLPVIDYEVLEVREARMVLKHVGQERSIKIGGGKQQSEGKKEKKEAQKSEEEAKAEPRKRDRRRNLRKKRGKEEKGESQAEKEKKQEKVELPQPEQEDISQRTTPPEVVRAMLTPPPLISETINRYKEDFKQAFYPLEEEEEQFEEEKTQEENFVLTEEISESTSIESTSIEQEVPHQEEEPVHQKSDLWDFSDDIPTQTES